MQATFNELRLTKMQEQVYGSTATATRTADATFSATSRPLEGLCRQQANHILYNDPPCTNPNCRRLESHDTMTTMGTVTLEEAITAANIRADEGKRARLR